MKNKMNQLFKDKLLLVMLVLGLLTIVAAAGAVKIRKGEGPIGENPYLEVPETGGILAENTPKAQDSGKTETKSQKAGSSDASYSAKDKAEAEVKTAKTENKDTAKEAGAGKDAAKALTLNFSDASKMAWPVRGNIILDYSMESTIYFPTLDQYKCNPALIIQGDVSQPVEAPADAKVVSIGSNEEIGNYVVLDLGNDYSITCGQMKDIQVSQNDYIKKGSLLGYISEPTKYYSIEGNNMYLALTHNGKPVDALDYLE